MNIEVQGIGIPNKGAELMLSAIKQHFEKSGKKVNLVLPLDKNYVKRAQYGVYQKGSLSIKNRDISCLLKLVPRKWRLSYGVILDDEIDVLLDASGFAYGDQWGVQKMNRRVGKKINYWKRANKKIIFLPQAFGPFSDKAFKKPVETMLLKADLIYARDGNSLESLESCKAGVARLCPDFTCLINPPTYPEHVGKNYGVCFIPNNKMLEMREDGNEYIESLAQSVNHFSNIQRKVTFLIHEGKKDYELALKIIEKSGVKDLQVICTDDPLEIKYVISKCHLVVSSRFHGLVSALSQGVPAVATGWSHKYKELMKDYGVEDLMAKDFGSIISIAEYVIDERVYSEKVSLLVKSSEDQKQKVLRMWAEVDDCIWCHR